MQAVLLFTIASAVQKPLAVVPINLRIPPPFISLMLRKFNFQSRFLLEAMY